MDSADEAVKPTPSPGKTAMGGKYLTFILGEEIYGIEITKIREIIGIVDITPVPKAPSFIKGVINLRGDMIPIVDMRTKFEMDEVEPTSETCIIVVEVSQNQLGILVDTVSEVLDIAEKDIDPSPSFGVSLNAAFILAMARIDGDVKILLNIDKVLSHEEFKSLDRFASS